MISTALRPASNRALIASDIALVTLSALQAPVVAQTTTSAAHDRMVPALVKALDRFQSAEKRTKKDIATCDTLDFDIHSNQRWDRLRESHEWTAVISIGQ